jgi:transposase
MEFVEARKLAVLLWHLLSKGESYVRARPALHARKLRDLQLKAGHKAARGQKGAADAYNLESHREQERRWVEQAEAAYAMQTFLDAMPMTKEKMIAA